MDQHIKNLVCSLKQGDKGAFDGIYELFHKKIFLFCRKYGLAESDAEEITQEVFVKLWLSRTMLDSEKNLNSYIYKISKNIIIDEFKKKIKLRATQEYQMSLIVPCNNVQEDMDYKDLKNMLDETLLDLPERRREVFELSRIKGLSHKEISDELGISTKTVENHLNLALHTFRDALQKTNVLSIVLALILLFN
ncbi:RNA polymerase sigma-70 factor, ECF subfamily [Algoriphagus locisalis]|uniref:RNA polymerase sigma-70 factor, ECF subfamily n=1 Tax=Algoriphagus locisalis TaxID=305507 RepID=A0A1I7CRL6_9BACT|nr:RNA polymerase sigma-70 factor [Algoriphagus locisalis]SFU02024.1 RNA polymerase sigma-70 factor, ECF subfamily [Algoriphagus locisalis]